jgi:phosphoribosylanthranilate isomerase
MTRVKICGIRDPETAIEAAKAGADFIGIMFAESRRRVSPQECYDITQALKAGRQHGPLAEFDGPGRGEVSASSWYGAWNDAIEQGLMRWRPLIVGVFADQNYAEVNDIADAAGLDLIQLSGNEDTTFVSKIERPVIRVVHVGEATSAIDIYDEGAPGTAASLMLDTGGAARGGTGATFDWEVAAEVARRWPLMLAGGLTPENVEAAVSQVRPWAVDVSSGVETDGDKDIEKVRAFIRAAKGVKVDR